MNADAPASPALSDDPSSLFADEAAAIARRRRIVLGDAGEGAACDAAPPRVGLALSGGGVRSATFSLGLLRGLAQARTAAPEEGDAPPPHGLARDGLLARFDYLSTVSGGGYVGAMFGRLVDTYGIRTAQQLMARSDSPVLHWLRSNGRYLTPAGSRDLGIAVVTYLRAWLAIHTEFMFACMLLGLIVVMPHLVQHSTQVLSPGGWSRWVTPWWPVALGAWVVTAPGLITGYWAARDNPDPGAHGGGLPWRDMAVLAVTGALAFVLLERLWQGGRLDLRRDALGWSSVVAFALASGVAGQLLVQSWMAIGREPHALLVARVRNRLTRALRVVALACLAIAGLGALDAVSWWVLEELQSGNGWLWGGLGFGSLVVLVLRTLAQPLQRVAAEAGPHAHAALPRLLNVMGHVGLLALVTAWLVVLQWFVFAPETLSVFRQVPAWMRAALVGIVWALWVLLTAGNGQMANSSSLHSFYRARLTRAYLAVGNRRRALDGHAPGAADNVTVVVDGDDTALGHYRPEAQGGPIHLVNTCLNQTRDDRSGLYNADRKGAAVTASWRGLEVGPAAFMALRPGDDAGTLGRWVAVSGAASSPGAGAYTSRGLALLVYFLGVRLGHWVRAPHPRVQLRWLSRFGWRFCPKPLMLASEASATFFGAERPWWYLSDGGHFENTGVYPLLKRELDFIVLSDGSCDEAYDFADIENLVRKARIDFGAEIDFYTGDEAAHLFGLDAGALTVLSPEDMADNHSRRGVMLARIRYRERTGTDGQAFRPEGTLLLIKPSLHESLDVDLLSYARQHPSFPHESTGDQSFDEAQWESYHRLGEDFGRALSDDWLARLPGWRSSARHAVQRAAPLAAPVVVQAVAKEPMWRRTARATALGTTLGLGASGTLLLSVWQVQEAIERNRADQQAEARELFGEVSRGLQAIDGTCPQVPEVLVSQVSLLLDLRGSPAMRPLEHAGLERLATRMADECAKPMAASAMCPAPRDRAFNDLCALVLKPPTENTALNYWHPGVSPAEQDQAAREVWRNLAAAWSRTGVALEGEAAPVAVPVRPEPAAGELPSGAPADAPATAGAPAPAMTLAAACQRAGGFTTLYIQVHDEASRTAASELARRLRRASAGSMLIAPIENVTRTAELRQQRRPVPWAQATFVLHDPASRGCAAALSAYVRSPWVLDERPGQVWVRDLPSTLGGRRPGVIELWLPPLSPAGASFP